MLEIRQRSLREVPGYIYIYIYERALLLRTIAFSLCEYRLPILFSEYCITLLSSRPSHEDNQNHPVISEDSHRHVGIGLYLVNMSLTNSIFTV